MAEIIPCRSDEAHYDLRVVLDGVEYTLEFRWNARAGGWFFDVRDTNGDPIFTGVRIVIDHPLAARFQNSNKPPGCFVAVDTSRERTDPAFEDLGSRVVFMYVNEDELPIVRS